MHFRRRRCLVAWSTLLLAGLFPVAALAQQVVQRGALGRPGQVLDETMRWTTPLMVSADHDVEIYIPDVSTSDWLQENYQSFEDKGQYVLSMFTFYKTPAACKANQIAWGFSDAAHLDACVGISYRVRQATVDTQQKTVTLIMAAMIGEDGQIVPESVRQETVSRTWHQLDANTQAALHKTNAIVARQMKIYDAKMQSLR